MRDTDDQDNQFIAMDLIKHPVCADPKPSCSGELARQEITGIRILVEGINRVSYAVPGSLRNCRQRLPGTTLYLNRKAHV